MAWFDGSSDKNNCLIFPEGKMFIPYYILYIVRKLVGNLYFNHIRPFFFYDHYYFELCFVAENNLMSWQSSSTLLNFVVIINYNFTFNLCKKRQFHKMPKK